MKVAFTAPIVIGHKGVHAVIVPFDPREQWQVEPVPLDDRREGWLVAGKLNGRKLEGWIGMRWGRYFMILDEAQRGDLAEGDEVDLVLSPTTSKTALAIAKAQAPLTTAPKKKKPGMPARRAAVRRP